MNGMHRPTPQNLRTRHMAAARHAARRFTRNEDGALFILAIVFFVLIFMMGAFAVDVMRYEQRRAEVQQTLDRSVLAAAAMNQNRPAQAVIEDYFAKAGLTQYLSSVDAQQGLNFRSVVAHARARVGFMTGGIYGQDDFNVNSNSGAEQRISDVEISMVLDISGSMNGSRINNLRPAAREFVSTVLGGSLPGRMSVSIVPYNAQVNIGRPMMNSFNTTPQHNASSCIELPDSAFNSTSLPTATSRVHNAHFDPYNYTTTPASMLFNCPPEAGNVVTPLTENVTTLHNAINALSVGGNTSIDVGVKWGVYLLDNSANGVIRNLVAANRVARTFIDRPLNPATREVIKVLVVMTDGENTTEYKMRPPYNNSAALSNIWRRNSNGRISVFHDRAGTSNDWWWPNSNAWRNDRDGGGAANQYTQLTWGEVWATWSVTFVSYDFYGLPLNQNWNTWRDTFMESVYSVKDTRLQQVCNAAKNANVIVYGIGFEAPTNGRTQVRNCATSSAHYFDANGLEIATAFRAIANNISQLRLTQ
ncbi:Flp pilus assembly protein TadG [Pseudorhodobacter antarcticus]|uniref:Flp pilus assembly protein TadG n=1 Tax=Pseudorhodobacter antarcticus TaxID=1077947 RepID=A0A1H8CQC6_9RHOB|nr:TadE/TadG family type IV pilus assembly protein [Pseudorhodobacter antarcticus]SEM96654.1 Flp pilus assembly protein TadG [Pseudorhodobacter antarcticus]